MDRKHVLSLAKKVPIWVLLIGPIAAASLSAAVFIVLPDFNISPISPDSNVVAVLLTWPNDNQEGAWVSSINGFQGSVSFRAISPPTIQTNISPDHVSLASGGREGVDILFNATTPTPGNQSVTIVASSQFKSHSFTVEVVSRKLTYTFSPSTISTPRNTSTNVTMTLSSVNGLSNRYYVDQDNAASYFTASFPYRQQFPLLLPRNGNVSTIMTIEGGMTGTYTFHLAACPDVNGCHPGSEPDIWLGTYNATFT